MRLEWSDEAPVGFDWAPVRATVQKLVTYVGTGKKVIDVLQSRSGGSTCSTRAVGPMKQAWNAEVRQVNVRTDIGKVIWQSRDAAKKQVDIVHENAVKGRLADEKVKVTAFSFSVTDPTDQAGKHSRFNAGFHCVWLIDGGEETEGNKRLYFVAYDQDVTCTAQAEEVWGQLRGTTEEEVVNEWTLGTPLANPLVRGMLLGGRQEGRLGPLIRFLYVLE